MMIWFSGMEEWMETMENCMKSGFWEIESSLKALVFCCGSAGERDGKPDLTATVTATEDD